MKWVVTVVGLGCLVAVTIFVCLFIDSLRMTTEVLPLMADAAIAREMAVTRERLFDRVDFMMLEVDQTRKDVIQLAASGVLMADNRLASIQEDTALSVNGLRLDFQRQGDAVNRTLSNFREDVRPVLAETHELLAQSSGTVAVLRPQMLGLIAASKVTAGQTAQAARRIDEVLPEYLGIGKRIGDNTDKITNNVERLTRPDKWYWQALRTVGPFATGWIFGKVKSK